MVATTTSRFYILKIIMEFPCVSVSIPTTMQHQVPLPPSEPKPVTTNLEINQRRRRLSRLLEAASSHNKQLDDEYLSLHQLHAEGKAGRRRRGKARKRHLPKVPAYLRESQPKTKYITDPAALTGPGQQDLQSAGFLINQLETGRVERLRRFQPKARRKKKKKEKIIKKEDISTNTTLASRNLSWQDRARARSC